MRASTWKLTGFALAPYLALPFAAARAGDVVVPEDAVVAAAAKVEQSTVILRITRATPGATAASLLERRRQAMVTREKAAQDVATAWGTPAAKAPVPPAGVEPSAWGTPPAAPAVPPAEVKPIDDTPVDVTSPIVFTFREDPATRFTRARGVFVGDGHAVLTAAVAVDGATKVEILREGGAVEAVVAGLDRDFDVAVLRTSASGPALEIDAGSELEPGRVLILSGASEAGGIEVRYVSARGGVSPRRGYGMLATSLPSASVGAPAVGPDGRVRGMVAGHAGLPGSQTSCASCHLGPDSIRPDSIRSWSIDTTTPWGLAGWPSSDPHVRLYVDSLGAMTRPSMREASPAVAHLVPGRRVARAVKDLLADGRVHKAYLGVVLDRAKEASGDARRVAQVLPGSPAEGRLLAGDRILAVAGRELSAADDVTYEILALEPNRPARVVVERAKEGGAPGRVEVEVTPTERKEDASTRGPLVFGFDVVTLTPELRLWTGRADGEGLLISSVTPGGAAERAGFARGDRVLKLAGRGVVTSTDLSSAVDDALRGLAAGKAVVLEVERDGKEVARPLHGAPSPAPVPQRPAPPR